MGTKVTVPTITSGYSVDDINTALTTLADAFDNTLSRDGTGPNQMTADLDLNSNDVLNAGDFTTSVNPTAFTPTLSTSRSSDTGTITYGIQEGLYWRTGDIVHVSGRLYVTSHSETGAMYLRGMPEDVFVNATYPYQRLSVFVTGYKSGFSAIFVEANAVDGFVTPTDRQFDLLKSTNGSGAALNFNDMNSSFILSFSGAYVRNIA